jgi:hypothetical protein
MNPDNNSYYEWYNKAERAGTFDRALCEYYHDDSNLYTAMVDGESVLGSVSIFLVEL